ncbi:organic solute transporter Ostalpha-domain-containing protein [Phanerochaete sordida]|uniref:Organic solute transporter Ostalpha-domain-containing protein n=1 Tax=Phanerochaete sordida TaxID=48140 RepID=A0A9P3GBU7_9APHY|nr:organic solute transporter Ostalpha-domain-containing protein [Phanerochaete sordida]
MADIVNGRCHNEKAPEKGPPLFEHGKLIVQAHDIGWLVTGIFTIASCMISFWLMSKHLRWYTNKAEQRYIVRILLMVPIYSIVSFASYLFWNHSTPLLLLRDCYESTVLTSFFYLLLMYISPDVEEQKEVFRKVGLSRENDRERRRAGEPLKKWMFPFSRVQWKPVDGLYFFQLMKWGVLQYCVIRPTTTLAALILDYVGLYCEDSWGPGWGHLYISVIVSASVSVAMYCLLQLYMPIKEYLAPQKPLLKLFAVKAVVFLTFWQASALSMLATFGLVKDTQYMTADNINIGIGAIMETVEMTIFAILHFWAFSYKPYVVGPPTSRLRSLAHAFNFVETLRELWGGLVYMGRRARGREVDVQARRQAALANVFGKSRHEIHGRVASLTAPKPTEKPTEKPEDKPLGVRVAVEETVHVNAERQWLGVGDDYAYGLAYHERRRREKSDGLEEQIEKELTSRGYGRRQPSDNRARYDLLQPTEPAQPPARRRSGQSQSWWRNIYNRLSQSEPLEDRSPTIDSLPYVPEKSPTDQQRLSYKPRPRRVDNAAFDPRQHLYDDPPPPSAIRSYRESKSSRKRSECQDAASGPVHNPVVLNAFGASHIRSVPPARPPSAPSAPSANSTPYSRRQSLPPTPSTNRSDSFFHRAFPDYPDTSPFSATTSLPSPSGASHDSRVRLANRPRAVGTSEVLSAVPQVVHPYDPSGPAPADVTSAWPVAHVRDVARLPGPSSGHYVREQQYAPPPSAHPPLSSPPGVTLPSPRPLPVVKSRLRRDQIVLPTPLAPDSYPSASALPGRYPSAPAHAERPNFAIRPPPDPSAPSQLRRSRHGNQRRHSYATSEQQPRGHASRRISFPLPESPIVEDVQFPFVPAPGELPRP